MTLRVGVVICVASIVVALSHSSIARPADQNHNKPNAAATDSAVVGIASTYNPFRPGYRSGGRETASGEFYDPTAWTAAIQTYLRERFGGVRYGKNYRPTYALVSSQDKEVIVKINDVGPLKPGRVIDLNEQTMRYFDPDLQRGLVPITITPLRGADWLPGPVAEQQLIGVAGLQYVRMRLAGLGKVLGICDLWSALAFHPMSKHSAGRWLRQGLVEPLIKVVPPLRGRTDRVTRGRLLMRGSAPPFSAGSLAAANLAFSSARRQRSSCRAWRCSSLPSLRRECWMLR